MRRACQRLTSEQLDPIQHSELVANAYLNGKATSIAELQHDVNQWTAVAQVHLDL